MRTKISTPLAKTSTTLAEFVRSYRKLPRSSQRRVFECARLLAQFGDETKFAKRFFAIVDGKGSARGKVLAIDRLLRTSTTRLLIEKAA